jgi:hypothetical protein
VERRFAGKHRELEDVHELMAQRVAELGVAPSERKRDASLEKLGDAENSFRRYEGQDVRLLEVHVRRINDQRNALPDLVAESARKRIVALLRVHECGARDAFFFRIKEDVDVLPGEHVPIETPVLNLVLAEPPDLRVSGRNNDRRERQCGEERASFTPAAPLPV